MKKTPGNLFKHFFIWNLILMNGNVDYNMLSYVQLQYVNRP